MLDVMGNAALQHAVDDLIAQSRPSRLRARDRVVPEHLVRRLLDIRAVQEVLVTLLPKLKETAP